MSSDQGRAEKVKTRLSNNTREEPQCAYCDGTGERWWDYVPRTCPNCGGTGVHKGFDR